MRKILLCVFICVFLFTSCIQIKIAPGVGFESGYSKLSEAEQNKIIFLNNDVLLPDFEAEDTVYSVSAANIGAFLASEDTSVIYFWSPHCHSENCLPLSIIENISERKGYKLLVLTEYYVSPQLIFSERSSNSLPIVYINHMYYKTNRCNQYVKQMEKELGYNNNKIGNRYLFFKSGKFLFSRNFL